MQDKKLVTETESFPESFNFLFKYAILVIQIRHVGHHEVQIDFLVARVPGFGPDVLHNRGQTPEVLIVREE